MRHIAVIGAGITGVTTAYALSERGYEVTVFDQQRYAGMETSFANGGQLSASNAEVWNKASTVCKGMRWMFRRDAPLLMNPTPGWHKYSWMAEFVRHIPNYRRIPSRRCGSRSRPAGICSRWPNGRTSTSIFSAAESCTSTATRTVSRRRRRSNELLAQGGLERRSVTPEEIREIEPTLKGVFYGGFFTPSDSTGDIHKFTRGLADACARRGVQFIFDAEVESIVPTSGGIRDPLVARGARP